MARPHRQEPKPEPAQHRANTALGQGHFEPRLDQVGQIHPAPAHHTILGEVWSFANQLCYCHLLLRSEPWFGAGRGAIGQPTNAFGIVANNPVAQRLWVHARPCRKPVAVRSRRIIVTAFGIEVSANQNQSTENHTSSCLRRPTESKVIAAGINCRYTSAAVQAYLSSARNWFMSESPVEHFEHAEHAEHAALMGDPFLAQVAVTIAILAVIAATVGSLETLETAAAIGDKNAAVLLQNKATDTWNFYQAKSIKKNLYAIAAANGGQKADDFKKQAERNGEDEQELFAKGQVLEHRTEEKLRDSERHEDRHHILTIAVTFLHVAIAIATIAIIVRGQRWPWYVALALGAIGTMGAAYAYIG